MFEPLRGRAARYSGVIVRCWSAGKGLNSDWI